MHPFLLGREARPAAQLWVTKAGPACFLLSHVFWGLDAKGMRAQHSHWGDGARPQKLVGSEGPVGVTSGPPLAVPLDASQGFIPRTPTRGRPWLRSLRPALGSPVCSPWGLTGLSLL